MGLTEDLDRSLDLVLESEGGWSNNPHDRGGRTKYGITEGTLLEVRPRIPHLPRDIRELTVPQARLIYSEAYFVPSGAPLLPWPLSYAQFDAGVQHAAPFTQRRAIKWLQKAIGGLLPDGVIGPATRGAIEDVEDWVLVAGRMLLHRSDLYIRILRSSSQSTFASGWANRLEKVTKRVLYEDVEELRKGDADPRNRRRIPLSNLRAIGF